MRIRLKGVASATKKLANGKRVTYWYAWRGGPRLEGRPGDPASLDSQRLPRILPQDCGTCRHHGYLHFHDLRGTAITRMALAGSTTIQIAAVTGHSSRSVQELLDRHYLGGQTELAEQAIKRLEADTETRRKLRCKPARSRWLKALLPRPLKR